MTTFVHIGDFHAHPGPRNADRYRALDQILDECERLPELGAWLWPGDLAHQRQTIEDKNSLAVRLQRMATVAPVVLVYGNHDLPGDLDVFAQLQAAHPIYVVKQPESLRVRLPTREFATIFCLPYPTKAGLVAAGVVPSDVIDVAAEALEHIFMVAELELREARKNGDLTLMVGHVNVGGAITCTGQPNIGYEIELSPQHLVRLGGIYIGLNHIHKHQYIGGAYYAGSVCRLDWGEVDPKYYNLVTLDGDEVTVTYKPIDVAPMFHIDGELTRDGFMVDDHRQLVYEGEVPTNWNQADWSCCEVRVRYRYRVSEKSVLDESLVSEPFKTAKRLKVEPVAIPDRALRAPAVAAATTLTEKVTAWAEANGVTTSVALLAKLAKLESTDPAQLLTEVRQELIAEPVAA